MAPKKAAKAKGDDDGDNPAEMNAALTAAVDQLKVKLVMEQERKDKSLTWEKQVRDNEHQLLEDLKAKKKETQECVSEMTESYKVMEQRLQTNIDKLTGEVTTQEQQMKGLRDDLQNLNVKKEQIIQENDE